MEKLLKLLKQYWKRTFNDETLLRIYYEEKTDCFCWQYQPKPGMKLEQGQMLETPVVFSKSFGFIKWLVENDKIDLDMARKKLGIPCCVWYGSGRIIAVKDVEDYEQILMLLSISDTPIDDLIKLLK